MDEQKVKSIYSHIIECYLYRVHGVYMSYVFYNYNQKWGKKNMGENMNYDYKINDY